MIKIRKGKKTISIPRSRVRQIEDGAARKSRPMPGPRKNSKPRW